MGQQHASWKGLPLLLMDQLVLAELQAALAAVPGYKQEQHHGG